MTENNEPSDQNRLAGVAQAVVQALPELLICLLSLLLPGAAFGILVAWFFIGYGGLLLLLPIGYLGWRHWRAQQATVAVTGDVPPASR